MVSSPSDSIFPGRAIVVDIDGTLCYTEPVLEEAVTRLCKGYNIECNGKLDKKYGKIIEHLKGKNGDDPSYGEPLWEMYRKVLVEKTQKHGAIPPHDNAVIALETLSKYFRIIYVTAREHITYPPEQNIAGLTREYIEHHFPRGMVIDNVIKYDSQPFKEKVLSHLKQRYRIVAGFGDTDGDMQAYKEAGILAIQIQSSPEEAKKKWEQIAQALDAAIDPRETNMDRISGMLLNALKGLAIQ